MLRRIVTYIVCFSIAFHPVPLYATNPDVTVLRASNTYAAQCGETSVNCLDVNKGVSGQVHLAFDTSLHQEGTEYLVVLDRNPIARVFFKQGQLNFRGYEGYNFSLESEANYTFPLFCAQAFGDLSVTGGNFSADSVFLSENLIASGIFNSNCCLSFQARQNLNMKGEYKVGQLLLKSSLLKLDAIAEAAEICVEAKQIDETPTTQLYARQNISFIGYENGFQHRGTTKSKNSILFQGASYTGLTGSVTLAGGLLSNQSHTIHESGRVSASMAHMCGANFNLGNPFIFVGQYFVAEATDLIQTEQSSMIEVESGAQLTSKGEINNLGTINHKGPTTVSTSADGTLNFPLMELFGHGILKLRTVHEQKKVLGDFSAQQRLILPTGNSLGISLKADKSLSSKGNLLSRSGSIFIYSPQLSLGGETHSGLFASLMTHIRSHTAVLDGTVRAHTIVALIDQYLKLNGLIEAKLTQVVFTLEEVLAKQAAELKAQQDAAEAEALRLRLQQEAEAAALLKAQQDASAAEELRLRQEAEAQAAQEAAAAAEGVRIRQEEEALQARLAKEAALKAQQEEEIRMAREVAAAAEAALRARQEAEALALKAQQDAVAAEELRIRQEAEAQAARDATAAAEAALIARQEAEALQARLVQEATAAILKAQQEEEARVALEAMVAEELRVRLAAEVQAAALKEQQEAEAQAASVRVQQEAEALRAQQVAAALIPQPEQPQTLVIGNLAQIFSSLIVQGADATSVEGMVRGPQLSIDSKLFEQKVGSSIVMDQNADITGQHATFAGDLTANNVAVDTTEKIDVLPTANVQAVAHNDQGGVASFKTEGLDIAGNVDGATVYAEAKKGNIAEGSNVTASAQVGLKIEDLTVAAPVVAAKVIVESKDLNVTKTGDLNGKVLTAVDADKTKIAGRVGDGIRTEVITKELDLEKGAAITAKELAFVQSEIARLAGETRASETTVVITKKLDMPDSGEINGAKKAVLHAAEADIDAKVTGGDIEVDIKEAKLGEKSSIIGTKSVTAHFGNANSAGKIVAPKTVVAVDQTLETTETSLIYGSETAQVKAKHLGHGGKIDGGQTGFFVVTAKLAKGAEIHSDEAGYLEVTKSLDNKGKLRSDGTMDAEVPNVHDLGDVRAKSLTAKATQVQPDVNGIFAGEHPKLTQSDALHLIVPNRVTLTALPTVACSLGLTAPSITAAEDLHCPKDISLKTTAGNLVVKDVSGDHVSLESNANLAAHNITARAGLAVDGKTGLDVTGNITSNGTATVQGPSLWVPEGKTWTSDILLTKSTEGDTVNHGTMQGREFLGREAKGDIIDEATKTYHSDGNKTTPVFTPALAVGGSGKSVIFGDGSVQNIGLMNRAEGQILNIASAHSTPVGAGIVNDADKGIKHTTLTESYVKEHKIKRRGLFRGLFKNKKEETIETSTIVASPKVVSGGTLTNLSKDGGLEYQGCTVIAKDKDNTHVHGDIIESVVTVQDQKIVKKKRFFGLFKSKVDLKTEKAVVTKIINGQEINHTSETGKIEGHGVQMMAPVGRFSAPGPITFTDVVTNNSLKQSSSALSPTSCGVSVFNPMDAPLLSELKGLGQSDTDVTQLLSGVQKAWSHASMLANAYQQGNVGEQLATHMGEAGVQLTKTKSSRDWQESTPSVLQFGEFYATSKTSVNLISGSQAHVQSYANINTPIFRISASTTEANSKSNSTNVSGGLNFMTYTPSASISHQKSEFRSVTHQNGLLKVYDPYGCVNLNKMDHLELTGGNIQASNIKGHVKKIEVVSLQDELHSKHNSAGVNASVSFAGGSMCSGTGGFSVTAGSSHVKRVNQVSGIDIANGFTDAFVVDELHEKGLSSNPLLAAHAKHHTFVPIYDVNKSPSFGMGMQGVDLSSGAAFGNSLAKNGLTLGAGFAAAELAHMAGANDNVASLFGTLATTVTSNQINQTFGEDVSQPESGFGMLGHVSYSDGDHSVNVLGLDISMPKFNQAFAGIQRAAESLALKVSDLIVPDVAEKLFAPDVSATAPPVVPVLVIPEPEPEPKSTPPLEVVSEDDDRHALRLKTDKDKVDVEDKAAEEGLTERMRQAAAKKQPTGTGKTNANTTDELPPLGFFGLPKAVRNLIENAPLIFEEQPQAIAAEERVEMRIKKKSPESYTLKEKMDHGADLHQGCLDKVDDILRDPNATWSDWMWAQFVKVGCQENLNNMVGVSGQSSIYMYGFEMLDSGSGLMRDYMNKGAVDQQQLDDFLYAGQHVTLAAFQVAGGRIIGGLGKRVVAGTANTFRKIFDFRNLNMGKGVTGFVDNPKAGIWSTARYSGDYAINQDPRYEVTKKNWTLDPNAPFNVFTHGNENVALVRTPGGMKPVNAKGFSKIMGNNADYLQGTPLHLFICNTGKGFAQQVSNRMDVPVFAPTDYMVTLRSGKIGIGQLKIVNGLQVLDHKKLGESRLFMPERGRTINDDLKASVGKSKFLSIAQNLLIDDKGSGKSPFGGGGPSKKAIKTLAKMKNNPANDWTVDDLETVGKGFGIEVKKGGNHILLKYPDGSQFGLPYSRVTVDKLMVKKFTRKIEDLDGPGNGSSFLKDDAGSIRIPTKREVKVFGRSMKDSFLEKLHNYEYKKLGWVPLTDKPRGGKWDEVTVGPVVVMNNLDGRVQDLKQKNNPKGPFTLVWEGADYMPFGDAHPWSLGPKHFSDYLYANGYKHGQPVALVSCNSERVAKDLSAFMQVPVSGFHGFVRPKESGGFKLIDLDTRKLGYMETFYPQPSYKKALVGAAGMAAGIAPMLLLRADTRNEEPDPSKVDHQLRYEGYFKKSMPFGEFE